MPNIGPGTNYVLFLSPEKEKVLRLSLLRNIARVIIPVFLLCILLYLANATVNQHIHTLDSGMMVNHAHPLEKQNPAKPYEGHHHTSSELILLNQISVTAFWIYLSILLVFPLLFTFSEIIIREISLFRNSDLYFLRNYHAPPETCW